ncbi:MAG: prepilin-type N-terminal cleavage/methylation domain-containing protein [bacterium]
MKNQIKKNKNKGFTLIELLVVIGIIALLSSVILSSMTQARAQADNAKQIADYRVVLNALLQFKQDNGYYPSDNTNYTCIGTYSGGCKVVSSSVPNSTSMNNSLQKYLSSYNFLDKTVTIISSGYFPMSNDYKGFVLSCTNRDTQCNKGYLLFPALKNKNSCPQIMSDVKTGDDIVTGIDEYTWCSVELN